MSLAKVSEKGQITVPVEIRKAYNINKASYVRIIPGSDGVKLVPVNMEGIASLKGVVKVASGQDFDSIRNQVREQRAREDH